MPDFTRGRDARRPTELAREEFKGRIDASRRRRTCRCAQVLAQRAAGTAPAADVHARRHRHALLHRAAAVRGRRAVPAGARQRHPHRARRTRRSSRTARGRPRRPSTPGDLVRVTLTFRLTKERRFVAVTDPLPAGFEPVESWFATTARDARAAQQDQQREARRATGCRWWRRGGFDHVERHDDRVQLFATRLSEGRHTFSYIVRATTAGTFRTAPAHAEEMYEPEVFGRTATARRSRREAVKPAYRSSPGTRIAGIARRLARSRRSRCGRGCGCGPDPARSARRSRERRRPIVVDRHGVPLYEALSGDGTRSVTLIAADSCPPTLVAATIAAEDRRFCRHPGVDPIAIVRAARAQPRRPARSSKAARRSRSRSRSCSLRAAGRRAPPRPGGEAARGGARAAARAPLHQARDPRAVPEPRVLRQPDRGRRAREPRVLRPRRVDADAGAGGVPRRRCRSGRRGFNPYRSPRRARSRGSAPVLRRMDAGRRVTLGRSGARGAGGAARAHAQPTSPFAAPHFVEMVLDRRAATRGPPRIETTLDAALQARRRGHHRAASAPAARRPRRRATSRSSCSTTRPASGWRGKDRATTSTRRTAARSTARSRRGSPDRR